MVVCLIILCLIHLRQSPIFPTFQIHKENFYCVVNYIFCISTVDCFRIRSFSNIHWLKHFFVKIVNFMVFQLFGNLIPRIHSKTKPNHSNSKTNCVTKKLAAKAENFIRLLWIKKPRLMNSFTINHNTFVLNRWNRRFAELGLYGKVILICSGPL